MDVQEIWEVLDHVADPEMPSVSVVELGLVREVFHEGGRVRITLIPTFLGCPALDYIGQQVQKAVAEVSGVESVEVYWDRRTPWSSDRINAQGQDHMLAWGIAPPPPKFSTNPPKCPFCGSLETQVESIFGATRCRSIFYCHNCHQPFEGMLHH